MSNSIAAFVPKSDSVAREGKSLIALQTCQAFPRGRHGSNLSLIASSFSDVSSSITIPVLDNFVVGHVMI